MSADAPRLYTIDGRPRAKCAKDGCPTLLGRYSRPPFCRLHETEDPLQRSTQRLWQRAQTRTLDAFELETARTMSDISGLNAPTA